MISKMQMLLIMLKNNYIRLIWAYIIYILFIINFIIIIYVVINNNLILINWEILGFNSLNIIINIIIDLKGIVLSCIVLFISANVLYFSNYYIEEEVFKVRFILIVILFVISINILIFIPHLITILLGWDGLGISSFVLVIYYQNSKSLAAGIITALTNRIGDVFILLRIAYILNQGHWLIINIFDFKLIIIILILGAAITKSAQMPFSSWLPAAIAAPTPVRALVHSSTLVTAGIFLLIRFNNLISKNIYSRFILIFLSCLTILIAGFRALVEYDLKKIVALSTLSQLGIIIFRIRIGIEIIAFFHLITHALFKALLFICVGGVIRICYHAQDIRFIGDILNQLPLIRGGIIIANIALCGIPFIAGFYSKDLIIEITLNDNINFLILFCLTLGVILTVFYSIRLIYLLFISNKLHISIHYNQDIRIYLLVPIILLRIGRIIGGCIFNWLLIFPIEEQFIDLKLKLFTLCIINIRLLFIYYNLNLNIYIFIYNYLLRFNSNIWFITYRSSQFIIKYPLLLGLINIKFIDEGWNEIVGPRGILLIIKNLLNKIQLWHLSNVVSQLLLSLFIIILFIIYIYFDSLIKA